MVNESRFVAIDWGTSSFRLWYMNSMGEVLDKHYSTDGMSTLSAHEYEPLLEEILSGMKIPKKTPTIICGMAGATRGWCEAPYIDIPIRFDAIVKKAIKVSTSGRDVYILSGLAQRSKTSPDVMRGEETQLLGLMADEIFKTISKKNRRSLICMPGTHSKWITIEDFTITSFSTFMTGELFDLLSTQSTLSHLINTQVNTQESQKNSQLLEERPAFSSAVKDALSNPSALTASLFSVRSKQLLFPDTSKSDMLARLLGILIGDEITSISSRAKSLNAQIILISEGKPASSYRKAFNIAGMDYQFIDSQKLTREGLLLAANKIYPELFSKEEFE